MAVDTDQEVQLSAPVASAAEFAGHKKKGLFGWDSSSGCFTICPADGVDYVRGSIHPSDAPLAATLNGTDQVTILQAGVLKRTTITAIGGGGTWQPLDADLTAIAALTTQAYGRSILTAADAAAARALLSAPAIADLGGYQPLDSDLTSIAALATTVYGRSLLTQADAATARATLGAGTSSFSGAYSALTAVPAAIDAIDGLVPAPNLFAYYTGASGAALATITAFARTILDDPDSATVRGTLSVPSAAEVAAGYQPLDSDLTDIAALTTVAFGRSLLTLANAAAARTALSVPAIADLGGYQPLDGDLTAIAALSTATFGRSLLTQADAATARATLGAGTSSFSGAYGSLSTIPAAIDAIDGLTPAADRIAYYTGASAASLATLTAFARSLLDDVDAAAMLATLGAASTAHAASHYGSDALAGQSIAGLRASDTPNWANVWVDWTAGNTRSVGFKSGGSRRFEFRCNAAAETGSDEGSNLQIIASTDGGVGIDSVLVVIRKYGGQVYIANANRPTVIGADLKQGVAETMRISSAGDFNAHDIDFAGRIRQGINERITAGGKGQFSALSVQGISNQYLTRMDASGNLIGSGLRDDGTNIRSERTFIAPRSLVALAASDTLGSGAYTAWMDAEPVSTKGWAAQLGAAGTLDFWNMAGGVWAGAPTAKLAAGYLSLFGLDLRPDPVYANNSTFYGASIATKNGTNFAMRVDSINGAWTDLNGTAQVTLGIGGVVKLTAMSDRIELTTGTPLYQGISERISTGGVVTGTSLKGIDLSAHVGKSLVVGAGGVVAPDNARGAMVSFASYPNSSVITTVPFTSTFPDVGYVGSFTTPANSLTVHRVIEIELSFKALGADGTGNIAVSFGGGTVNLAFPFVTAGSYISARLAIGVSSTGTAGEVSISTVTAKGISTAESGRHAAVTMNTTTANDITIMLSGSPTFSVASRTLAIRG